MKKKLFWLIAGSILLGLVLIGGYLVYRSLYPSRQTPSMVYVLGIDYEKGLAERLARHAQDFRELLAEKKLAACIIQGLNSDNAELEVLCNDSTETKKFLSQVVEPAMELRAIELEPNRLGIRFKPQEIPRIWESTREQIIKTIRNRLDIFGIEHSISTPRPSPGITVAVYGKVDAEQTGRLLARPGTLEFRLVDDQSDFIKNLAHQLPDGIQLNTDVYSGLNNQQIFDFYLVATGKGVEGKKTLLQFLSTKDNVPRDREISFGKMEQRMEAEYRTYLLYSQVPLTGERISKAEVQTDDTGSTVITLEFDSQGAKKLEELTAAHIRQRLAIVLEGEVNSAPMIQERISGGQVHITFGASVNHDNQVSEAIELSKTIQGGSYPAPVRIEEERQGPAEH